MLKTPNELEKYLDKLLEPVIVEMKIALLEAQKQQIKDLQGDE